ncbi:hypothetical protein [Desulfitobacterium metallireducens]|uniref:Uncharacterized protein n=1 Tax=Desulfitobacterium metallireducens DSM 15288 TaxID=871968 RepID=W0EDC0_9FIRM|nr:hypothetical protein [Desulfitobacterium metallireducens]AHF07533.1 hypothetical protein DESME_11350 [Desulfitobacterium metallireducens DSM 15288]
MQEEEHEYHYQLKPLIFPGILFLIGYPVMILLIVLAFKISILERYILSGLYIATLLGILVLWIYGRSKHLRIDEDRIIFYSLAGEHLLAPEDIRRVALYTSPKGEEVVQIKTSHNQLYYISELYFPFPELMSDLEQFVANHAIRSNMS